MTINIDGNSYYGTLEICKIAGISRATLFRWLKKGVLQKQYKNRRGWRVFTAEDLDKIRKEATRIDIEYIPEEVTMKGKTQPRKYVCSERYSEKLLFGLTRFTGKTSGRERLVIKMEILDEWCHKKQ